MIGTDVSGGLGNQFFRYAAARKFLFERQRVGIDEEFVINGFIIDRHGTSGSIFDFNLAPHAEVECKRLVMEYGSGLQKAVYAVFALSNRLPFVSNTVHEHLKKMRGRNNLLRQSRQ